MKRFGGMVRFRVRRGEDAAVEGLRGRQLWTLGESLGGVESLIEHPGRMTHASVAGTELEVPADLIRLSVGIEDADDLIADLREALDHPRLTRPSRRACTVLVRRLRLDVHQGALLVDVATVRARHGEPPDDGIRRRDILDGYRTRARGSSACTDDADACWPARAPGAGCGSPSSATSATVTAEAGHRVGLSAGAKVVHVAAGRADDAPTSPRCGRHARTSSCSSAAPTAATRDVLLHNAARLAKGHRRHCAAVRSSSPATSTRATRPPRCSRRPGGPRRHGERPARRSASSRRSRRGPRSARCSSATSSAARGSRAAAGSPRWSRPRPRTSCCAASRCSPTVAGGDVLVVDVGGATTDVYSVPHPAGRGRHPPPRGRRHALARPHRRGRPRDAVDGGRCGGGWRS